VAAAGPQKFRKATFLNLEYRNVAFLNFPGDGFGGRGPRVAGRRVR
jgi:hypothetical protein